MYINLELSGIFPESLQLLSLFLGFMWYAKFSSIAVLEWLHRPSDFLTGGWALMAHGQGKSCYLSQNDGTFPKLVILCGYERLKCWANWPMLRDTGGPKRQNAGQSRLAREKSAYKIQISVKSFSLWIQIVFNGYKENTQYFHGIRTKKKVQTTQLYRDYRLFG